MAKDSRQTKQPMAQSGTKMKEMYRLYALDGDLYNPEKKLLSIIGIEGGGISYTYKNDMIQEMLQIFDSPVYGIVRDTDPPEKYFKALEIRFSRSGRIILIKTGKKDK